MTPRMSTFVTIAILIGLVGFSGAARAQWVLTGMAQIGGRQIALVTRWPENQSFCLETGKTSGDLELVQLDFAGSRATVRQGTNYFALTLWRPAGPTAPALAETTDRRWAARRSIAAHAALANPGASGNPSPLPGANGPASADFAAPGGPALAAANGATAGASGGAAPTETDAALLQRLLDTPAPPVGTLGGDGHELPQLRRLLADATDPNVQRRIADQLQAFGAGIANPNPKKPYDYWGL